MQWLSFLDVFFLLFPDTLEGKKTPKPTFCSSSILPTKDSGVLQTASYLIWNFTQFYKWRNLNRGDLTADIHTMIL